METKITKHFFEYATNKYFRGNAYAVDLGCFGEKKDPPGAKAHLDVHDRVAVDNLNGRVHYNTTARVDWAQTTKAEAEGEGILKFFGLNGNAAMDLKYENAKSAKLQLVNFAIDEGPLKTMLNKDAGAARNFLAGEGNDGRIVSEVWIVVDGELAEHFATSGSISLSANGAGQGLALTAKGGKQGTQTIALERGTTFAYKLHKVKDWNKGKTVIEEMDADYKGNG
jgi:hypothetical protein